MGKYKYKGLEGIAALKKKREDEKDSAEPRKGWQNNRGMLTRFVPECRFLYSVNGTYLNRREKRRLAKKRIQQIKLFASGKVEAANAIAKRFGLPKSI